MIFSTEKLKSSHLINTKVINLAENIHETSAKLNSHMSLGIAKIICIKLQIRETWLHGTPSN